MEAVRNQYGHIMDTILGRRMDIQIKETILETRTDIHLKTHTHRDIHMYIYIYIHMPFVWDVVSHEVFRRIWNGQR